MAYVELKPNMTVTVDELLAFAQTHIGERAAVPKEIVILDKLPLTAVGKLYKPALIFSQIEQVFQSELAQISEIGDCRIQLESDKRLGTVAKVSITGVDGCDLSRRWKQRSKPHWASTPCAPSLTCNREVVWSRRRVVASFATSKTKKPRDHTTSHKSSGTRVWL